MPVPKDLGWITAEHDMGRKVVLDLDKHNLAGKSHLEKKQMGWGEGEVLLLIASLDSLLLAEKLLIKKEQ